MFALDFRDADTYASTFTEDGVLDYGPVVKGRDAIRKMIEGMAKSDADRAAKDTSGLRPAAGRHNISNIVIKIDSDKAKLSRAYWFHYSNNNPPNRGSGFVRQLRRRVGETERQVAFQQAEDLQRAGG